ncbi:MAG: RbsD/FucU family protein [Oscillospiraceae bacterium]|nr:RbsD/FucU family protein [Oscillospiraceae bacterium]
MLKGNMIHPEIMETLSLCGHGCKVLIADGNYPLKARTAGARCVYLGLTPGLPTVTDVLKALLSVSNFESAEVMLTDDGSVPEIFADFKELLPDIELKKIDKESFYAACCEPMVELAISTGEKRTYANILLTVGCS